VAVVKLHLLNNLIYILTYLLTYLLLQDLLLGPTN